MNKKYAMVGLSVLALCGSANAQLKVHVFVNDGTPAWEDAVSGGYATINGTNVSINTAPDLASSFRVFYEGTLGDIGVVSYNVNDDTVLVITTDTVVIIGDELSNGADDWGGLAGAHPELVLVQASITGALTGPVTARKIPRLDIDGSITGDILIDDALAVANPRIGFIDAGGSISGDIETQAGDITQIKAGASISSGSIISDGDIDLIDAVGSISGDLIQAGGAIATIEAGGAISTVDILAVGNLDKVIAGTNITCETIESDGTIDLVYAGDGDIGTSTTPTFIRSNRINGTPGFNIGIVTGDNIYAEIVASSTASANGNIRRIIAADLVDQDGTVSNPLTVTNGDFTGSLVAYDGEFRTGTPAIPTFDVADIDGTLEFQGTPLTPIVFDTLTAGSLISIAGELAPVTDPAVSGEDMVVVVHGDISTGEGLLGQIIVNAGDDLDTWTGPIDFTDDNFLLEDMAANALNEIPFYERLPATLGGGAIGQAPFNFHNKACLLDDPGVSSDQFEAGDTTTQINTNDEEIIIEHYGPVYATGTPLVIHKLVSGPIGTETSWENSGVDNDVTSSWDQSVSSTEDLGERTVTISPVNDTWVAGWYRARPDTASTGLKCAFVSGNPPVVYDIDYSGPFAGPDNYYYFRVKVISFFDMNQNMVVDAQDASIWLSAPVDFNDDNSADAVDFQMLLNNMD